MKTINKNQALLEILTRMENEIATQRNFKLDVMLTRMEEEIAPHKSEVA